MRLWISLAWINWHGGGTIVIRCGSMAWHTKRVPTKCIFENWWCMSALCTIEMYIFLFWQKANYHIGLQHQMPSCSAYARVTQKYSNISKHLKSASEEYHSAGVRRFANNHNLHSKVTRQFFIFNHPTTSGDSKHWGVWSISTQQSNLDSLASDTNQYSTSCTYSVICWQQVTITVSINQEGWNSQKHKAVPIMQSLTTSRNQ